MQLAKSLFHLIIPAYCIRLQDSQLKLDLWRSETLPKDPGLPIKCGYNVHADPDLHHSFSIPVRMSSVERYGIRVIYHQSVIIRRNGDIEPKSATTLGTALPCQNRLASRVRKRKIEFTTKLNKQKLYPSQVVKIYDVLLVCAYSS
jgi:hypothetical protein